MARSYNLICEETKVEANYIGVTSVLGELINKAPYLMKWKAKQVVLKIAEMIELGASIEDALIRVIPALDEKQEETLDIGTHTHKLIENYIIDGSTPDPEKIPNEVFNSFMAFLEWEKDNIVEWLDTEKVVYSNKFAYAGSVDGIAKMTEKIKVYADKKREPKVLRKEGSIYVIDFKTSSGFYSDMALQIAGYTGALIEMKNDKQVDYMPDGAGILRLDKETGKPEWKDYSEGVFDKMRAYQLLVSAWWAMAKRRIERGGPIQKLKEWKHVE